MRNIETKINLDLKPFLDGLKKAEAGVEDVKKKIDGSIDKKAFEPLAKSADETSKKVKGSFEGIQGALVKMAGAVAVAFAIKGVFDFTKATAKARYEVGLLSKETGAALDGLTAKVQATADTFGKDFQETLVATNALAKGFGISMQESTDIINQGFLAGGDATGEMLDQMREYSGLMKIAGLDASQFTAIIAQTAKEGIYSDKGVDTLKEGLLRIREMPKAASDAINALGLSSDEIQARLTAGTTTVFEETQNIIAKMNELPATSQKVGTAIADIFGGAGEDSAQFLMSLDKVNLDLSSMVDNTDPYVKQQQDMLALQESINGAMNDLGAVMLPVINGALNLIVPVIEFLADNLDIVLIALGGLAVAFTAIYAPVVAATVAQWALNAAMLANPLGLIIAGIAAVVAAIIIVVEKTIGWKKIWEAIVYVFNETINWLVGAFKSLSEWVKVVTDKIPVLKIALDILLYPVRQLIKGIDTLGKAVGLWGGETEKAEAPLKKTGKATAYFGEQTGKAGDATGKFNKDLTESAPKLNAFASAAKKAAPSLDELRKNLAAMFLAGKDGTPQFDALQSKIVEMQLSEDKMTDAVMKMNAAIDEQVESLKMLNREITISSSGTGALTKVRNQELETTEQGTIAYNSLVEELQNGKSVEEGLDQYTAGIQMMGEQFYSTFTAIAEDGKITMSEIGNAAKAALIDTALNAIDAYIPQIIAAAASISPFLVPVAMGVIGMIKGLASSIKGRAEGEVDIAGPGTGTSDSILSRVSKGESVITAKATSQNKTLLEYINKTGKSGIEYLQEKGANMAGGIQKIKTNVTMKPTLLRGRDILFIQKKTLKAQFAGG